MFYFELKFQILFPLKKIKQINNINFNDLSIFMSNCFNPTEHSVHFLQSDGARMKYETKKH